ncbi:hypothetical protein [uncultured Algoriphagus sp.]|mgnify:CR=1 FL=1|uniref:hypothetical protein n=1 Tax=uncultured Algoriphagus sp. TaxID=417365 RepID=UPI0030EB32D3|tara:strand:- start:131991 stop:132857 length:867 start_codon:yes stop_codon:yes gene_type:complete
MKAPGYFTNKPQFKIIGELRKTLGFYDSIPTTIELVINDYVDKCKIKGVTPENELNTVAKNFTVKNHNIQSLDSSRQHIYNFYILSVFNVADSFFRDLKKLMIKLNSIQNWKTKSGRKDLDAFNQVIENCKSKDGSTLKSKPEFHLINYYRLHRNSVVHRVFKKENQFSESDKYYDKYVLPNVNYHKTTYNLDAPNKSDSINLHDFLIYTRAIKYYNNLINDACYNLTESNLVDFALSDEALTKKLKGFDKASDKKKQKPLKNLLQQYFKLEQCPEFDSFYRNYLMNA